MVGKKAAGKKAGKTAAAIDSRALHAAVLRGVRGLKAGLPLKEEDVLANALQPILDNINKVFFEPLLGLVERNKAAAEEAGEEAHSGQDPLDEGVQYLKTLPEELKKHVQEAVHRVKKLELHDKRKAAKHLAAYYFLVLVYTVSDSVGVTNAALLTSFVFEQCPVIRAAVPVPAAVSPRPGQSNRAVLQQQ